jgi:hypothetical protein
MRLIEKYKRRILLKRAAEVKRTVRIIAPDKVRKAGIIWMGTDIKAFNFLQEYFRAKSVIVRNICFSSEKESTESNVLTGKDLNWLGFPVGGTVQTFLNTDFDLLMNVSATPCFPLDVITALSAASFKIGWDQNGYGFYDLTVNVTKNPDSLFLAEQIIFYLTSLKSST